MIPIRTLDIFMFQDGELMNLDSYQRIDVMDGWKVQTASRKGDRRLFMIANGQWKREDWMAVNSYQSLEGFRAGLENETYRYPTMCGECRLCAEDLNIVWMEFKSLCSEVVLKSIHCDFSRKNYEEITDIKAYLINVNAGCGLMMKDEVMPERIINMGGLNEADLDKMKEPELLFRQGGSLKSGECLDTDFRFRCYPNNCPEESPGSPFTKLVIEGRINGQIFYWPINVGRNGSGGPTEGVLGNHKYIYEVTITGKGSDSPEIPAYSETFCSNLEVLEWEEKEEYAISF